MSARGKKEGGASVGSTKPYLIRALYEWCVDQGFTPYLSVVVNERTQVPRSYVKDGQIVLNLSPEAVHQLVIGNEFVTCSARFGGVAQPVSIPIGRVAALYARENGNGMAFELDEAVPAASVEPPETQTGVEDLPPPPPGGDGPRPAGGRPRLTRVK